MQTLISQLGLDWKLLLSQAVNFIILLVVLRYVVYKPLIQLLHRRRAVIEEGVEKAEEADRRLQEVGALQKEKIKEAQKRGEEIVTQAQETARRAEQKILAEASAKEHEMINKAKDAAAAERTRAMTQFEKEAGHIVKKILAEVVEANPECIDDALIQKVSSRITTAS